MLKSRVFWGIVLLVTALILLIFSGRGIFTLLNGPETYEELDTLTPEGKFVKAEVSIIFDIFAEEASEGEAIGQYAVIPYGDKYYIAIYIPKEYSQLAQQIRDETERYLDDELDTLNNYFFAQGTIKSMSNDIQKYYMDSMEGLEDYALAYVLEVGTVGYLPVVYVIIMTVMAIIIIGIGILLIILELKKKKIMKKT